MCLHRGQRLNIDVIVSAEAISGGADSGESSPESRGSGDDLGVLLVFSSSAVCRLFSGLVLSFLCHDLPCKPSSGFVKNSFSNVGGIDRRYADGKQVQTSFIAFLLEKENYCLFQE